MNNRHQDDIQHLMGKLHPAVDELLRATGHLEKRENKLQKKVIRCPKCHINDIHAADEPPDEFLRFVCRRCGCRFGISRG